MSESRPGLAGEFAEVLGLAIDADRCAVDLFQQFLAHRTYSRSFASSLIEVAQGGCGDAWEVRRLAALMLQEHLLSLPAGSLGEFQFVLDRLGLAGDGDGSAPDRVLREGYTRRDLPGFVREFRRRLSRPRCAVRPRERRPVTGADVRALALQSRQECKLALGREVFRPEEVVARVRAHVTTTDGIHIPTTEGIEENDAAVELPDYEAEILRILRSGPVVYWAAAATPTVLNSLVEYPIGTVVLVVKPPGSHHEFEWKRAGRRGDHPLSVRSHVPPSHRLDGGSMMTALQWDARSTAVLSHHYRLIHAEAAPISRIVQILGKFSVPGADRERLLLEYLTERSVYGEGYDAMRKAMAIVTECFRQERGDLVPRIPGDYGLTGQFLAFTAPAQATVCGSSSFRLDLAASYLSADGPEAYFRRGLQVEHRDSDAKQLADDVLDEVLGVYVPPDEEYRDHDQYVAAALAVPRNRARADAVYLGLLKQMGTMWGTLLGLRGYSFGESFVARNVGVRTTWDHGGWRVRLVFQDHDNLVLPDETQDEFWPMIALPPTRLDSRYVTGEEHVHHGPNCLMRIYRVDDALREEGRKRLRGAIRRAYAKTQLAMRSNPLVKSRFDEAFIERLPDWDAVARLYLARDGSSDGGDWKARVQKFLRKRGYDESSIDDHCRALEQHGSFVDDCSFLYRARTPVPSAAGGRPAGGASRRGQPPAT